MAIDRRPFQPKIKAGTYLWQNIAFSLSDFWLKANFFSRVSFHSKSLFRCVIRLPMCVGINETPYELVLKFHRQIMTGTTMPA